MQMKKNSPYQMTVDVVHIDTGEEELVNDDGAEVLVLKLVPHGDERCHHAVHERVLNNHK